MYLLLILAVLNLSYNVESFHSDFKFEVITTLKEHSDEVKCLAQLSNELIASGSKDTNINIWNIQTGTLVKKLIGHTGPITSLVSLENDQLASSSTMDSTIRIWNIQSGEQMRMIEDPVSTLVSLKDGRLASASKEFIKIWDVETGFLMNTLNAHEKNVNSMVVLHKKNLLISGSSDKTIILWDLFTFELKLTLADHQSAITTLTVCSNGLLASGSWDHTIKLWNISRDDDKLVQTIQNDQMYAVRSLASLQNGYLASGSFDFSDTHIYIWNPKDGSLIETLKEHSGVINALITLTNGQLVSGSADNSIKIWANPHKTDTTISLPILTKSTSQIGIEFSKKKKMVHLSTNPITVELPVETTQEMRTDEVKEETLLLSKSVSCMKFEYLTYSLTVIFIFGIKWLF